MKHFTSLMARIWKEMKENPLKTANAILAILTFVITIVAPRVVVSSPDSALADSSPSALVENFPVTVFTWTEKEGTKGKMWLATGKSATNSYGFEYDIPDGDERIAGIAFKFNEPTDLSMYEYLELTIDFMHDSETKIELDIKDVSGKIVPVRLGGTVSQVEGVLIKILPAGEQVVRIPLVLDKFNAVNKKFVTEIAFVATSSMSKGQHKFIVSQIRFGNI